MGYWLDVMEYNRRLRARWHTYKLFRLLGIKKNRAGYSTLETMLPDLPDVPK